MAGKGHGMIDNLNDIKALLDGVANTAEPVSIDPEDHKFERKRDTANKRRHILSMARKGKSKKEIMEVLQKEYGHTAITAKRYTEAVFCHLKREYEKYVSKVAEENVLALLEVRDELFERQDYKTLLQTIDLLNKTCSVYNNAVKLEMPESINIKFN